MVRERAGNALLNQTPEHFVAALKGEAPAAPLFRHCAQTLLDKPEIALAIATHPRAPHESVAAAAKRLPTSAVQDLMEDFDRLSNTPALVAALMNSASLTADQRQLLEELLRDKPEGASAFTEAVADAEADDGKRATLIQRLAAMKVVERVQLALKGGREDRIALIRDPCKVVQRAVLQSSRITDREVEGFAAMASLTEEILRVIATNRNFRRNYTVVRNLVNNPKTPLDITLHMLPNLTPPDLKSLSANKNISDTLRKSAMRLVRQRTQARGGE